MDKDTKMFVKETKMFVKDTVLPRRRKAAAVNMKTVSKAAAKMIDEKSVKPIILQLLAVAVLQVPARLR